MGLKDALRYRKAQGYNGVAMIAAFPHWARDGRPRTLKGPNNLPIRQAWPHPGTNEAKAMHDEDGNRPFFFPGKVPGLEDVVPDLDRINPAYFRSLDRKIDYMNAQGFVPFIEPARRDIGHVWKAYHDWPASYARYVQYVWSRYQANNCLFSPIHYDWAAQSIPAEDWRDAVNLTIDRWGHPPFGTLVGPNASGSSLENFGHIDKARFLTFHQIGNQREHVHYRRLTEIFHADPPIPGLNGEPYYDGFQPEKAKPGTALSALYCRSGMYGSVLSGGLAGHIYGAQGLWAGEIEEPADPAMWHAFAWESGDDMRHLKTFAESEGALYQQLIPSADSLSPNRSGPPGGYEGWAYCAKTEKASLLLLYFEKGCPRASLSGLPPRARYRLRWFDPREGAWIEGAALYCDDLGGAALPAFPGGADMSDEDWALKLRVE